ncbi:UNVERIFIED_CONTAM: hypothetical protein HDU68_006258, partial [Siphonaria sp. JEL0065]
MTQEKKVDEFVDHNDDAVGDIDHVEEAHDVAEHIEFIVPQTDDPNTPAFTFRSVFLGVLFAVLLSFANTALSFRSAPFAISAVVAVIVSYPMGLFLAKILPAGPLNPGPFSVKEHVLIYIMSSVSGQPYGIDNVITQMHPDLMGNTDINFIQSVGFVLVTQFLGYGFSGLTRRFLVKPTAMWWPGTIPTIAMFASFHKVDGAVT